MPIDIIKSTVAPLKTRLATNSSIVQGSWAGGTQDQSLSQTARLGDVQGAILVVDRLCFGLCVRAFVCVCPVNPHLRKHP